MAQGRPPRHSKSKRDPVTIDLEAEKGAASPSPAPEPGVTAAKTDGDAARPQSATATPPADMATRAAAQPAGEGSTSSAPPEKDVGSSGTKPSAVSGEPVASGAAPQSAPDATAKGAAADRKDASPAGTAAASAASAAPSKPSAPAKGATASSAPKAEPAGKGARAQASQRPHEAAAYRLARAGRTAQATASASPAAPASARPSGGAGRGFAAGLLGGIVVAGGLYLLQDAGVLPAPGGASSQSGTVESTVSDLRNDVDQLKQTVAARPAQAPSSGQQDAARLSDLSGRLDALEAKVSGSTGGDLKPLADAVSGLETSVKQNSGDIASLTQRTDAIDRKLAEPSDAAKMARTIALASLRSAIDRGGPFAPELNAYESIASADGVPAPLKQAAAAGVKSRQALVDAYPDVADRIMAATSGPPADAGIFDRLLASAQSVVKVRPTGNPTGTAPDAIVARMGTKLKSGDLKGVVDEWSALPDAGKSASQSFIDDVKARLAAEDAVNKMMTASTAPAASTDGNGQAQ